MSTNFYKLSDDLLQRGAFDSLNEIVSYLTKKYVSKKAQFFKLPDAGFEIELRGEFNSIVLTNNAIKVGFNDYKTGKDKLIDLPLNPLIVLECGDTRIGIPGFGYHTFVFEYQYEAYVIVSYGLSRDGAEGLYRRIKRRIGQGI